MSKIDEARKITRAKITTFTVLLWLLLPMNQNLSKSRKLLTSKGIQTPTLLHIKSTNNQNLNYIDFHMELSVGLNCQFQVWVWIEMHHCKTETTSWLNYHWHDQTTTRLRMTCHRVSHASPWMKTKHLILNNPKSNSSYISLYLTRLISLWALKIIATKL